MPVSQDDLDNMDKQAASAFKALEADIAELKAGGGDGAARALLRLNLALHARLLAANDLGAEADRLTALIEGR